MKQPPDNLEHAASLLEELERIEQNLRDLRDGLTRSHRLATLGTMASIIAHEFNNILTPMISYCQLALRDPDDVAMLRKAVSKSLQGAEHAARISQSMLGFTGPGEGTGPCRCELAAVVRESFSCLARPPEKDGLTVKIEVPDDCTVAMQPIELQQVLLNLLLNARRAMKRKHQRGGRLSIRAAVADEADAPAAFAAEPVSAEGRRWVVLRVCDSGDGIDTDLLPHVFQPFVTHRQPDENHHGESDPHGGTGLGLAICRELIETAGGRIEVEHTGPDGTTFRIDLPAADPPPA